MSMTSNQKAGTSQLVYVQACSALGYAAQATHLLGAILGVPLRYPLVLSLSRSSILDRATGLGKIGYVNLGCPMTPQAVGGLGYTLQA